MSKTKVKISQSFLKDATKTKSADLKVQCLPAYCPQYLKFKYVDGLQTAGSDAMLLGRYFEWHLLGATRDGVEPILPRKGVRDLRPTKSASKNAMTDYIVEHGTLNDVIGSGPRKDLKPSLSSGKPKMIEYLADKNVIIPEKSTKESLYGLIVGLPNDFGEPEVTQEDLFAYIQTLPENLSEGEKTTVNQVLDLVIENAKRVLYKMGLDVEKGDKQVKLTGKRTVGHLDWVTRDLYDENKLAIYDVKYTQTRYDDWRNGWLEPDQKEDAKIQASHYIHLWHENTGEYIPFYFLVFGEKGWIRVLKYEITAQGMALHEEFINIGSEWLGEFVKNKWKARPEYNRCLECEFNELCQFRANLPEIENILV